MDRTRRELLPRIRTFGLQTLGPCERLFSLSDQQGFENLHSWPEHPQDKRRLDTRISGKVRIPKISYAAIYNYELRVEWPMAPSSRTKLDTAAYNFQQFGMQVDPRRHCNASLPEVSTAHVDT